MKINFILPEASLAGGIRVVAIYAKLLLSRGHEVFLVSQPHLSLSFFQKLRNLKQGKGWEGFLPKRHLSHLDDSTFSHRVLETRRPVTDADVPDADVTIATWWETAEWVKLLAPSKGAKVYFIQHHELFDLLPAERVKATYKLPFHKIVIADWLRKIMEMEYGDYSVDLVPNSVDTNQFNAPIRAKRVVPTVGFLFSKAHFKGVDVTLSALSLLKKKILNLRIVAFGAENPHGYAGWLDDIEFHYKPQQQALKEIYAECDVWVTASRTEGFNLPAMEAMACRVPVVSTPTGWPEEAIKNGINGYLVDFNNPKAIEQAVATIFALDVEGWMRMSAQAHSTATEGSWEQSASLFESALELAISKQKSVCIEA